MLTYEPLLPKIDVHTAENEPSKEPSTRLFLPSRTDSRTRLKKPPNGLRPALMAVEIPISWTVFRLPPKVPSFSTDAALGRYDRENE